MTEALSRRDVEGAPVSDAERALLRFVVLVTEHAWKTTAADVQRLRDAGWTDEQIGEAVYITALFAFFNRVADAFGLEQVHVVTMQAVSGAGLPGVPSMSALDNVIPFIGGEEEKMETETRKILGRWNGEAVEPATVVVSAHCNRVAVIDGHTECVSVRLARKAGIDAVQDALAAFRGAPQELRLPSAPERPIVLTDRPDRPQPRLDRDQGRGMAVTVGRLRPCPIFDYKFVVLSHNTVRGAAGGAILLAELALARGALAGLSVP